MGDMDTIARDGQRYWLVRSVLWRFSPNGRCGREKPSRAPAPCRDGHGYRVAEHIAQADDQASIMRRKVFDALRLVLSVRRAR